ncbi:MAG: hypothetical protein FWD94_05610 [Treponema sp.]|nr:hypothetical protein [Treponema sp.]
MKNMTFAILFILALALSLAGCTAVPELPVPEGRVFIELGGGSPGHNTGIAGPAKSFILGDILAANTNALGEGGFTFQWRRGGKPIPEAMEGTYALQKEDIGYPITVIAFSENYSGGVISDPTFPVLTGDEKSANSIAKIAELDIGGTLWVGETLEVVLEWKAGALGRIDEKTGIDDIVFQWMRSAHSQEEPKFYDYMPIPGANDPEYKLTRADRDRWIKVIAVHPDYDWYIDGYFDDWEYGSFKIEPVAYGPVSDPGTVEIRGPNSVTREESTLPYVALRGGSQANPSKWILESDMSRHYLTNLGEASGVLHASYGEKNRWVTIRADEGEKKVLVRSRPPLGDWKLVTAYGKGIRHDGTLWSWGENAKHGMVGDGGTAFVSHPKQIMTDMPDVGWVAIASGEMHQVALNDRGELWSWGASYGGTQLGVDISDVNPDNGGNWTDDSRPVRKPRKIRDSDWATISAGSNHNIAVKRNGALWAWGRNYDGLLGNGTFVSEQYPVSIGNSRWKQIATGTAASIGIDTTGNLYTWGPNHYAQLGIGIVGGPQKTEPTQVVVGGMPGLKWAQAAGGNYMTLAIDAEGRLWSWGSNRYGQLGRVPDEVELGAGDHPVSSKPGRVVNYDTDKWKLVSALPGTAHVLAIDENGKLWAWGENYSGQIGNGEYGDGKTQPIPWEVKVDKYPNAVWISASVAYGKDGIYGGVSMAVMEDDGVDGKENGSLWAWGNNTEGFLGLEPAGMIEPRPRQLTTPKQ